MLYGKWSKVGESEGLKNLHGYDLKADIYDSNYNVVETYIVTNEQNLQTALVSIQNEMEADIERYESIIRNIREELANLNKVAEELKSI